MPNDSELYAAVTNGDTEAVIEMLDNGANPDAQNGSRTALYEAARKGHTSIVEALLTKGANAESADDFGAIPLHAAAENGHLEIVKLLVKVYQDYDPELTLLNETTSRGLTPLY